MAEQNPSLVDVTLAHLDNARLSEVSATDLIRLVRTLWQGGVTTVDTGRLDDQVRFQAAHTLSYSVPEMSIMAQVPMNRRLLTHTAEALKPNPNRRLGLIVPISDEGGPGIRRPSYTALFHRMDDCFRYGAKLGFELDMVVVGESATDPISLGRIAQRAVAAGASGVTLVESRFISTDQMTATIRQLARAIPGTRLAVRFKDHHGLGANLSVAALEHGASEVGMVVAPWQEEQPCPSLDQLVRLGAVTLDGQLAANLTAQGLGIIRPRNGTPLEAAVGQMKHE